MLDLGDGDAAGHFGALGRAVAKDFELIHRERENDVAFAQVVEPPATEQVREVINDDEVCVETGGSPCLTRGAQGKTRILPSIPSLARLPTWETACNGGP